MDQQPSSNPTPTNQPTQNLNNDLYGHLRLGMLLLGIVALTIIGRACGKKKGIDNVPGQAIKVNHVQPVVAQRNNPKTFKPFIPPEGSITITPKDPTKSLDELVSIHYQEIGWTVEPGFEFSGNLYYSYGVDAKLFYFYRFGLGAGIVTGSNTFIRISPDVFLSYRLDQIYLRNTEAIVTWVPAARIPYGVGLRLNF